MTFSPEQSNLNGSNEFGRFQDKCFARISAQRNRISLLSLESMQEETNNNHNNSYYLSSKSHHLAGNMLIICIHYFILPQSNPVSKGMLANPLKFFFFNFVLNWRIIALQYWLHFCHASTWIRHRCTYVVNPLFKWENRDSEGLNNFPRVTQLVNGRILTGT